MSEKKNEYTKNVSKYFVNGHRCEYCEKKLKAGEKTETNCIGIRILREYWGLKLSTGVHVHVQDAFKRIQIVVKEIQLKCALSSHVNAFGISKMDWNVNWHTDKTPEKWRRRRQRQQQKTYQMRAINMRYCFKLDWYVRFA